MKNYLKFVVAIVGVTVASFGAINNAQARKMQDSGNVCCKGAGSCGYTGSCEPISGTEGPC